MKRVCKSCGIEKEIEEFVTAGIKNCKQYYRHICKDCFNSDRQIKRNKDAEKFREYKKTLKCAICGYDDYRALEFHHIDESTKEYNIGSKKDISFSQKMKEIEKCIVLCANCHRIHHYDE